MNNIQKKIQKIVVLAAIMALLPACWGKKEEAQEGGGKLYVINVLDKQSHSDCAIAGSINVPFEGIAAFAQKLDKNVEIIVYCANYMCSSSGAAAKELQNMGFQRVWAYEGGTAEWYQMNRKETGRYPVQGACKASYLSAPNAKVVHDDGVPVITAQELRDKMVANGLIS